MANGTRQETCLNAGHISHIMFRRLRLRFSDVLARGSRIASHIEVQSEIEVRVEGSFAPLRLVRLAAVQRRQDVGRLGFARE